MPCDVKSALEWASKVDQLILDPSYPPAWSRNSNVVCKFRCTCGKIFERRFCHIRPGRSRCGRCHVISIRRGDRVENFTYEGKKSKIYEVCAKRSISEPADASITIA